MLDRMEAKPKPLERPLVVLGGYADPGLARLHIEKRLGAVLDEQSPVLGVGFAFVSDFDSCRDRVIQAVQAAYPSQDPSWTVEVDVVGFSMGGLVARYAAMPALGEDDEPRRLRVRRLFTISTPHRGAMLSDVPHYDPVVQDMREGSAFLRSLDDALEDAGYEIYPYVRLGDNVIGPEHAAPPGRAAWWVSSPAFSLSHVHAHRDPRILADIARRLRGEAPLTARPPAPLPRPQSQ